MAINQKRILLAVDGSNQCMAAVRYAGQIFSGRPVEIRLSHILSPVPELFYDLGIEPESHQSILNIRVWEGALQDAIHAFMDEATRTLVSSGISREFISTNI